MSVPVIGYFLLWLGFILFLTRPASLLHAAVFLSFFENTAILIRESPAGTYGLPAWSFFLLLAFVSTIVASTGSKRTSAALRRQPALTSVLLLFAMTCALSLVVPLYVDGGYGVPSPHLSEQGVVRPARLDAANFLIALPFFASLVLAVMVWRRCTDWGQVRAFLRTVVSAVFVVAILGLWELVELTVGFPYPQQLFRSLEPDRAVTMLGSSGVYRLSSVAAEPSALARVLLVGLTILVLCRWRKVVLFGRSRDALALPIILAILLLSASSSALIGLGLLIVLGATVTLVTGKSGLGARSRALLSVSGATTGAWMLYQEFPAVRTAFSILVTAKIESESYLERTTATSNAFRTFFDFPWLGIGLGESASYDLPAKMLSNIGLAGTALFVLITWQTVRGLWSSVPPERPGMRSGERQAIARALIVALGVQLGVAWVAGFHFETAYFWVLFGVSWGCVSAGSTSEHPARDPAVVRPNPSRPARWQ